MSQGGAAGRGSAKPQDRGWAWMVLLAAVVLQGLTLGFPCCIGVFFTDLQHEFQASNSQTSWFPSIMVAVLHGGGFLVDITRDFHYVFYNSSFFLISAALFMGISFCALFSLSFMSCNPVT